MNRQNVEDWLVEFEIAQSAGPDAPGVVPTTQPDFADTMNQDSQIEPQSTAPEFGSEPIENPNQNPDDSQEEPEIEDEIDGSNDEEDFEVWKSNFFKETVKGNPNDLIDLLSPLREKDELLPYQRKFVEDNWNIQLLRLNSNVLDASKSIRKNIKDQLDKNNPATSIVNHISNVLDTMPHLNNTFIKMMGYSGNKGELHRKFLAALTGSVQVSSSPDKENIILNEREYSVKMATRLNSEWGDVVLGSWSLREDDPERYLSEPEIKRLSEGSPDERDVLRRRVIIESIAKQFEEQSFIINVVADDGTIHYLGWDVSNALRGAYTEGKLVIKINKSENSEAMINDDGAIIPVTNLKIMFVKQSESVNLDQPSTEEIEFIEKRNGMLFLTAGLLTIKEASTSLQGTEFKEIPYNGNPSDLKSLRRCVYSAHDMIMRQC
jgi:hypothetical protein